MQNTQNNEKYLSTLRRLNDVVSGDLGLLTPEQYKLADEALFYRQQAQYFTKDEYRTGGELTDKKLAQNTAEEYESKLRVSLGLRPISESKYIILKNDGTVYDGQIQLRRIMAARDIKDENGNILVHKGEKGGYVEGPHNLSQEGTCWVYDHAMIMDSAVVKDSAQARDYSVMTGFTRLSGNAVIKDSAKLHNSAIVSGNAEISDRAYVIGYSNVTDNSIVTDIASIQGKSNITGNTVIKDGVTVFSADINNETLTGYSRITGAVEEMRSSMHR